MPGLLYQGRTYLTQLPALWDKVKQYIPWFKAGGEITAVDLVGHWQVLHDYCEQAGQTEAANKLNELFPLLNTCRKCAEKKAVVNG